MTRRPRKRKNNRGKSVNKRACGTLLALLSLLLATAAFADEVDWPYYGGDQGGTRYTPADQINRDNFDQLRVIWRYRPPISKSTRRLAPTR